MPKIENVPVMSEGDDLSLEKINSIIRRANDRRILSSIQFANMGKFASGDYSTNDADSQIRIEARSLRVDTAAGFGEARVNFTGKFTKAPVVVVSWGDVAGMVGEGRNGDWNPPALSPSSITTTGFSVFGGRASSAIRINYIAVGPVG